MEMAVSTVILIIIGIAVLIGLLILVMKEFDFFNRGTEPVLRTSGTGIVKQACEIACRGGDSRTFCCEPFNVSTGTVYCKNSSINLDCSLDCSGVVC